jgi:ribosomal protein L37AE/L43A
MATIRGYTVQKRSDEVDRKEESMSVCPKCYKIYHDGWVNFTWVCEECSRVVINVIDQMDFEEGEG